MVKIVLERNELRNSMTYSVEPRLLLGANFYHNVKIELSNNKYIQS